MPPLVKCGQVDAAWALGRCGGRGRWSARFGEGPIQSCLNRLDLFASHRRRGDIGHHRHDGGLVLIGRNLAAGGVAGVGPFAATGAMPRSGG